MLIPTVVMAMVVGIGVGINTQTRQRDKRQRHKKCQTSCAYSQTDCSHLHTPGPHRTRGGPSIALGQMSRRAGVPYINARSASGSYVLGQRIQNSPAAACEFDDVHRFLYELPNACTKRTRAYLMRRDQPEQRRRGSAHLQHPLATECQESAEVGAKHHPNWKQPSAVGLLSYFSRTSTAVAEDGSILRELTLDPSRDYQRVAQAGGST